MNTLSIYHNFSCIHTYYVFIEVLAFLNARKDGLYQEARSLLENSTSLMCASKEGHYDVVQLLLEKGAQMDLRDGREWAALMYACHARHYKVAKILLEDAVLQSSGGESLHSSKSTQSVEEQVSICTKCT